MRGCGGPPLDSDTRVLGALLSALVLQATLLLQRCGAPLPDSDTRVLEEALLSLVLRLIAPDMSITGGRCNVATAKGSVSPAREPVASEKAGLPAPLPKQLNPQLLLSRLMLRPAWLKALTCTDCLDALAFCFGRDCCCSGCSVMFWRLRASLSASPLAAFMLLAMLARLFCFVSGGWDSSAAGAVPLFKSLGPLWPQSRLDKAPCRTLFCCVRGVTRDPMGDLGAFTDHRLGSC